MISETCQDLTWSFVENSLLERDMMAALFLLFAVAVIFIWQAKRGPAILLCLITLFLCWMMFWYHATEALKLRL